MLVLFQSIAQLRETHPFIPLALIGVGILAALWLLRRTRIKRKAKPVSLKRLEDRHSAAISEIGSIKMNQWMDKRESALIIPRRESPPSAETQASLKEVTAFQAQALVQKKVKTDKTEGRG